MQQRGLTSVKRVFIAGTEVEGLVNVSETGYDEDGLDVEEYGNTGKIGSGQEKVKDFDLTYNIFNGSQTQQYFFNWRDTGKNARDVVIYYCDKSGDIQNAYRRELFQWCEMGAITDQEFSQGERKVAQIKVHLF